MNPSKRSGTHSGTFPWTAVEFQAGCQVLRPALSLETRVADDVCTEETALLPGGSTSGKEPTRCRDIRDVADPWSGRSLMRAGSNPPRILA